MPMLVDYLTQQNSRNRIYQIINDKLEDLMGVRGDAVEIYNLSGAEVFGLLDTSLAPSLTTSRDGIVDTRVIAWVIPPYVVCF